jgi:hypothetical protein
VLSILGDALIDVLKIKNFLVFSYFSSERVKNDFDKFTLFLKMLDLRMGKTVVPMTCFCFYIPHVVGLVEAGHDLTLQRFVAHGNLKFFLVLVLKLPYLKVSRFLNLRGPSQSIFRRYHEH